MQLPQQIAPYLEALTLYAFRDPTRFHVPGPKGGLRTLAAAGARLHDGGDPRLATVTMVREPR